jgi:tetratricopeptide (TPR) repeat protein
MESGNASKAEKFLSPLVKDGLPGSTDPEIQRTLATALISEGKFRDAQGPAADCLKLSNDPASRAQALLLGASIQRSLKNLPLASSMIDEAMLLQPEGPINAQARILAGDLFVVRQDYANAAKAYVTVAVLSDDPSLAPKALAKAIDAYRRAGDLTEAEKSLEELKKRFPDAPLPPTPKS